MDTKYFIQTYPMNNTMLETIIVGGGVSGLSCARRLHDAGRDFLLITEELGGRLLSAECCGINYGAAYMTSDYVNMLQFVQKKEELRVRDFFFWNGKRLTNVFILKNLRNTEKIITFLLILKKVRRHFLKYRAQAAHKSIKECFENDPVLMEYWNMNASVFIKKHGFERLDTLYGNPVTAATAFIESKKVNAFYYIGMFFPLLLKTWIVDLRETVPKLTRGYEDKITIARVTRVSKKFDYYTVESTAGHLRARNVVFAAPQKSLLGVYPLPKPHIQEKAYVFHISGVKKAQYRNKKAVVFRPENHDIFMIWELAGCADIIYSRHASPDFSQYYESYQIVRRLHWSPGMIIPDNKLIAQKLDDRLYLASDYNLSLMEDCFLTGVYAANQIINKTL